MPISRRIPTKERGQKKEYETLEPKEHHFEGGVKSNLVQNN